MTAAIANTTTTVVAGEGGLGPYISFCQSMAATCENGLGIVETTLGDMYGRGWGAEKTRGIEAARDQLTAAQQAFNDAAAELQRAIGIAEQYDANPGAGDKESVTNR